MAGRVGVFYYGTTAADFMELSKLTSKKVG